ncbi:hypothetical protein [Flavobacterium silvaticum]|uniref:Delta-60 repeat domain-containing protein n=1 Tax=Flavobacterium silvaticum TaxID=1852020 RepID=A0A972JF49_9FLAO|nr:hypothetical protein [Flavobacterium silvaticum]NMH26861.1 hypothetical protein [Flavobacterium silvaticum]
MKKLLLSLFLGLASIAMAQDGQNDPTFNPTDIGFGNGVNGTAQDMVLQPDGKIVLSGFSSYDDHPWKMVRLNDDESVDTSFSFPYSQGLVHSMLLLPDGKFLISADIPEIDDTANSIILRLNADGSLDESFPTTSVFGGPIFKFTPRPDGKFWITGWFTSVGTESLKYIALLNADGTVDPTVVINTNNLVFDTAIQPDGKLIIVGAFSQVAGQARNCFARLNADNSLDTAFVPTGPTYSARSVELLANGKMYVTCTDFLLRRYNSNGTVDNTFLSPNEYASNLMYCPIVVQPDGKILVGGGGVTRFNDDGTVDENFQTGIDPMFGAPSVYKIRLLPDGKFYVAGGFSNYEGTTEHKVSRRNTDGTWDAGFDRGNGTGADNGIGTIINLDQGNLFITGSFDHYNDVSRRRIAKLTINGELDESFDPGTGFDGRIFFTEKTSSGKILISGNFSNYNGQQANHLILLNPDGTVDNSFQSGSGFTDASGATGSGITAVRILDNGKILVSGNFDSYNGVNCPTFICLNADGSRDYTFNTPFLPPNHFATNIINLPGQQKILVTLAYPGIFYYEHDIFFKIDYSGNVDSSFHAPSDEYTIYSNLIAVENSGTILLIDQYLPDPSALYNRFLRLDQNGNILTVFADEAQTPNGWIQVSRIFPQVDGKFFTSGEFTSLDNEAFEGLVRHNHDGSPDTTFDTGTPITGVSSLVAQDERLIIAGGFIQVNGIGRNRIARLYSSGILDTSQFEITQNEVEIFRKGQEVKVASQEKLLSQIAIFDYSGRQIAESTNVNSNSHTLTLKSQLEIAIIKVTLKDGFVVTKKMF